MKFGFVPRRLMGNPGDTCPPNRRFDDWIKDLENLIKMAEKAGFEYMASAGMQSMLHFARYAGIKTKMRFANETLTLPMLDAVQLAPAAGHVDQMLGGRLDFGVAIGYRPWDLQAAGITRKDRVPKFEESIVIIKLMWTQDEVSFHGKYFNFDDLPVNIKPYQKPHPPIVVSTQSHGSSARAGRLADGICIAPAVDHRDVTALSGTFRASYRETNGKDPTYVAARRDFFIGPNPREAARQAGMKEEYLQFKPTHDYIMGRIQETTGVKLHLEPVKDEVPGNAIAGSYKNMLEQFARVQEDAKLTHVTCSFFNCPDNFQACLEFVEGFGEEVISKLR